jgi:hypothetical protein
MQKYGLRYVNLIFQFRFSIIANGRIIRPKLIYEFYLLLVQLFVCGGLGFPQNLLPCAKVASLLSCKILLDQLAIRTAEIGDAVRPVLADINLAVWVCDFVNDFHAVNTSQVWATNPHKQDTLSQLALSLGWLCI